MSHPRSQIIPILITVVLAACDPDGQGETPPSPARTISDEQLAQVDLSEALFTLEDLLAGSRTLITNEDYVTSTVPRLILCGEDVRRELNALTGRFAQLEGPPDIFLLVNHAVSGLPGDFAQRLLDRLEDVGAACNRTWTGPGLNNRSTEFEVVGSFPLPELLDKGLALEIAHRQEGQEDVRLFLVYVRAGQFLSAFTLLLDQDSDTDIVANMVSLAGVKLEQAVPN